nr:M20/M25/M40 family metallo-hydrolase [Gemmatimonadaceae bacterium]
GMKRPPMIADHASRALVERIRSLAIELDMAVSVAASGGGSDANFAAALGVATVDGLGAVGSGAHALDEHVLVSATLDRVALLAAILSDKGAAHDVPSDEN